jgi:hypothetical protein
VGGFVVCRTEVAAAHGHPLLVYSAHGLDRYPNANGPLGLVPLVPIVVVANALGLANNLQVRAGMVGAVVAVFALQLGTEAPSGGAWGRSAFFGPKVASKRLLTPNFHRAQR